MSPSGDCCLRNFLVSAEFCFSIYRDLFAFWGIFARILLIILQKSPDWKKIKEYWPFLLAMERFFEKLFWVCFFAKFCTYILDNTLLVYSVILGSLIIVSSRVSRPPWKNEVTPFSPAKKETSVLLGPLSLGSPHQNVEELISSTLKTGLKNNFLPLTK